MNINISTSKGRTKIATDIDCDFESEQDWQDFMLELFSFLQAAGVDLPEEIETALDEFYD
jgi:hypothetical protein